MRLSPGTALRFRRRYPAPWKIDCTPSGFTIVSGSTTLLYIYVHREDWQNTATTGQHKLTWAEGLTLAQAIVALSREPHAQSRN
jgi:hypothetical protein